MPTLTIDIEARFAQAIDAVNTLTKKVEGMGAVFNKVQHAAGLLGVAFTGVALARFVKGAIDAQDKLNDLSKSTGVAVETLGGLGFAAKQSGSDLEGVAQAVGKLNIQIAKAAAGNKEASAAFDAIGVNVRDAAGKIKSGDQVFAEIADRFEEFRDGPNKAALGLALFGKAYQQILPLLDEGGAKIRRDVAYFKQYSQITQESAKRADELNDELEKAKLHFDAMGTRLANEIVPSLLQMAEAMTELQKNSTLVVTVAKAFGEVFKVVVVLGANVAYVFAQIALEAEGMAKQLQALATLDFERFSALRDEMVKRAEGDRKAIDKFSAMVMNPPPPPQVPPRKTQRDAPGLPDAQAAADALALRKKALDAQLKQLDSFVQDEDQLLRARQEANQGYYSADLIAVQHFFDLQDEAQRDSINNQRRAFDEQARALREFAGDVSVPVKDRIEAMEKLTAVVDKQARSELQAASAITKSWFDRNKAVKESLALVTELTAQLAESGGDTVQAAAIRRTAQNAQLRQLLQTNNPGNVPQLDELERRQAAMDRFNKQITDTEREFSELGRTEREIQNELIKGEITQTEALEKTDQARRNQVLTLQNQLQAAKKLADETASPDATERVKELEQAIKDLEASSNLVGTRMRALFQDAFIDPFVDLINHTKTADEALKAFFQNVAQSLLRLEAQNIAERIFGGRAGGGGVGLIGGFFGLFGGAGTKIGTVSAKGNVMTDQGPLKLERYARGGIARRPMVSIFGEGSMPEAYVPLPDGRAIPVQMRGQEGGRLMAGPSAVMQRQPTVSTNVTLQLHPNAMHLTLRDWFEGEMSRQMATR